MAMKAMRQNPAKQDPIIHSVYIYIYAYIELKYTYIFDASVRLLICLEYTQLLTNKESKAANYNATLHPSASCYTN